MTSSTRLTSQTEYDSTSPCYVSVFSWNGSAVPGEQLRANRRRCWSSASAVRQSTEVDRSPLYPEQFRSSVFCGPVDLEFAIPDSLRDPALSLDMFRRQLKTYFCEILTRCTQRIRDLLIMRYINLHFTYLLTHDPVLFHQPSRSSRSK